MEAVAELTVQGVRLEAVFYGSPPERAPTLVFLHGGLACRDNWRDLPKALAEATDCGALAYSRRGHGRSEAGPSRWPVSFMHDEAAIGLPEVLRTAGVREPILVGHSDGASIALLYAGGPSPSLPPLGLALLAPHVFVEPRTVESIARLTEEPARQAFLTGSSAITGRVPPLCSRPGVRSGCAMSSVPGTSRTAPGASAVPSS